MNNVDSEPAVKAQRNLRKRYRAEARFRFFGVLAMLSGVTLLLLIFTKIIIASLGVFHQTYVQLEVDLDVQTLGLEPAVIDQIKNAASAGSMPKLEAQAASQLAAADYNRVIRKALTQRFPDVKRTEKRALYALISVGASYQLRRLIEADTSILDKRLSLWLLADSDVDNYVKSHDSAKPIAGRLSDKQRIWIDELIVSNAIKQRFNFTFFTAADSSEPEQAGIFGALMGSLLTLLVTACLSFPVGVAAAVYLEEYAKRGRFTEIIEVNINNLAAVPSVIFGLLGLAVFLNLFGLTRHAPLVAGMVLTLLTLPTIIISSRAAIAAVPKAIRESAYGLGASKMQTTLHHVLPLAMPGMLTGAILGVARALGESAPLLMIGMAAFIADVPKHLNDAATVLPVQIYLWAERPEYAFLERTAAAIVVLLVLLLIINGLAIWMRRRVERRW